MKMPNPMNLFRADVTQQQAAPTNMQQQGNQQQQNTQQGKPAGNGQQPTGQGNPGGMEGRMQEKQGGEQSAEQSETSPMDKFKDLWEPNKEVQDTGNSQQQNSQQPGKTGPKKPNFAEIAKTVDFSLVLSKNPELVSKAMGGDQVAFGQVMNQVAQAAFAASGALSHQMSQGSISKIRDEIMASLPAEFKKFSLADTSNSNAAFRHPAMRPIFELVKNQIMEKYPDATTGEIDKQAEEYMAAVYGEAFKDTKKGGKGNNGAEESSGNANTDRINAQEGGTYDWSNYLN